MKELVNNKLVFRNFFSLTLAQGINALLQLLVVPFVIKKIGIENFGLVAVAQVVMFLLSTLAEYGYGQTGSRAVAQNRTDTEMLSKLFYHSIYLRIILCSVGFLLLLLLSLIFPFIQQHFILYALAFVFVPGQALLPFWFFQGMEKLHWMAAALLLSKILFVLLVFIFISTPVHTSLFIFFLGLGNFITAIAASVFIIKRYHLKISSFSMKEIKRLMKEGAPVTAANLTMNLMQYGNLFILRLYSNDLMAGYFSVAERIYFAMKQVLTAFAQSIYPALCRINSSQYKNFFKKTFLPFFWLMIAISAMVALFAPSIIGFFIKDANTISIFIFRMCCIAVPVVCLNMPGALVLLATNQRERYFKIFAIGLFINLLANLLFAPQYYAMGTVAAVLITEVIITVLVSLSLFKYFHQNQLHY